MKKADNFDAKQWLVENKVTFQSRLNENEMSVSPKKAVDMAMGLVPKLEKSPEMDELALKIASNPAMIKQLSKILSSNQISLSEELDMEDMADIEKLAFKFAQKASTGQMNEFEIPDWEPGVSADEDTTTPPIVFAAFAGGGTIGAMFSQAIGAAIPALTGLFAGPAVAAALTAVALVIVAKKVYKIVKSSKSRMNEVEVHEAKVKNKYVVKDEELSDEDGDFYVIDKKKALDYLKQFNSKEVDAKQFIKDDEGWGEFEQYLEDVELMTDKELEDSMREELSFYYFSEPDGLD